MAASPRPKVSRLTQSRHRPDRDPAAQQSPVCYPFGRKHRRHRTVERREFITLLGGAAVAWPLAARAQPAGKIWRIGMLDTTGEAARSADIIAFRRGLAELGY